MSFLTINKGWLWQEFELSLLRAGSMAELRRVKATTPQTLRSNVMALWVADGRYKWLERKVEVLSDEVEEHMFYSSDKSTWPKVGSLVRASRTGPENRPYEVIKRYRDENGFIFLYVKDVETGQLMDHRPLEDFFYWPVVGKPVGVMVRDYLDWLVQQRGIQASKGNDRAFAQIEARLKAYGADNGHVGGDVGSLFKPFSLIEVKGSLGVIEIKGDRVFVPMQALFVPREVKHY